MSETINQDDHETLRITITIEPDSVEDSLTDAEEIIVFLTDRPRQGQGTTVAEKSLTDGEVTVIDGSTIEIELKPDETRGLAPKTHYAEATVIWDGNPSTTSLSPGIDVKATAYDSA